ARGATGADMDVIVAAADAGVMPQPVEAIDHAQAAKVPIIVAVNKIDKPNAEPDRVKKQLADRGLNPEEWGGSTIFVNVSAKQKTNLNTLLEMMPRRRSRKPSRYRRPPCDRQCARSQARPRTRRCR